MGIFRFELHPYKMYIPQRRLHAGSKGTKGATPPTATVSPAGNTHGIHGFRWCRRGGTTHLSVVVLLSLALKQDDVDGPFFCWRQGCWQRPWSSSRERRGSTPGALPSVLDRWSSGNQEGDQNRVSFLS